MLILGFQGSPRVKGKCSRLVKKLLEGAASRGAETKLYDLVKLDIRHCLGCMQCFTREPDLPVGRCPLKDDMAAILDTYVSADGYVFASPVYDVCVTALMKKFLERKIALTYRPAEAHASIGAARVPAHFLKKAAVVVTGNCPDELCEVMGDPCFELMEAHLVIEQVDTVGRLYMGSAESIADEALAQKLEQARQLGVQLVDEIEKSRCA